jgi:hypothetical protein
MRLGFTIKHQNRNSSQNSGQKLVVQRQRRQGRFHQQERSRIASLFWDAEGILFIDYLEMGKKIPGEYYSRGLKSLTVNVNRSPNASIPESPLLVIHFCSQLTTYSHKRQ